VSGVAHAQVSAPATVAAVQGGAIGEVVITAERRTNTVQKTSIAIDVLTGEALKGVTGADQLGMIDPGLQIGGPTNLQVYVRGVGDNTSNSRNQPGVPFNLDGVYLARGTEAAGNFFDLNRIELLKGPQGTLYGRNASGGIINIITNRPSLAAFGGDINVEYGNYNSTKIDGALNVPLTSTLAARGAFQYTNQENYTTDSGSQNSIAGRVRVLWTPTPDLVVLANADIEHVGGEPVAIVSYPAQGGNPWKSANQPPYPWTYQFNANTAPYTTPNDSRYESTTVGTSAEIDWKTPYGALTLMPAYRRQGQDSVTYASNFRYVDNPNSAETTLEARFANDIGPLKYVVGYYHYYQSYEGEANPIQGNETGATKIIYNIDADAGFGQATYSITDKFRLIGGGRYTVETTNGGGYDGKGAYPYVPFTVTSAFIPVHFSAKNFSYKGGAEYDLTPKNMLYVTASTGFKGGGFTITPTCGSFSWQPETLLAYDVGSRNRFLDDRLQINGEGFVWQYHNQQISALNLDSCGDKAFLTYNIGQSTIYGADLDIVGRITANDTVHLGFEYAHGTYNSFSFTQLGAGNYAPALGSKCSATATGGGFDTINCNGQSLTRLPQWSGDGSYEHVFKLANEDNIAFHATMSFTSTRLIDIAYLPNDAVPATVTGNADLTYNASKHWSVALWVKNIGNTAVYSSGGAVSGSVAPNNGTPVYADYIDPPRTFGVRLSDKF
jgi:iron complex outermembrane receptor protein